MASISQKITSILNELEASSDVSGCAVVSNRGQVMASVVRKGVDEKSVAAMAAALISVAGRVGKTLGVGNTENVVISGTEKIILTRPLKKSVLIAMAPSDSKIGLLDYEIERSKQNVEQVLG